MVCTRATCQRNLGISFYIISPRQQTGCNACTAFLCSKKVLLQSGQGLKFESSEKNYNFMSKILCFVSLNTSLNWNLCRYEYLLVRLFFSQLVLHTQLLNIAERTPQRCDKQCSGFRGCVLVHVISLVVCSVNKAHLVDFSRCRRIAK